MAIPVSMMTAPRGTFQLTTSPRTITPRTVDTTGITYVTVRESRSTPGRFRVVMRTKSAWAPGVANETELTTDVTLKCGARWSM